MTKELSFLPFGTKSKKIHGRNDWGDLRDKIVNDVMH